MDKEKSSKLYLNDIKWDNVEVRKFNDTKYYAYANEIPSKKKFLHLLPNTLVENWFHLSH